MSIWRNTKKWVAHPDHFIGYEDCKCYIEKFNLEIWNKWRVDFYKDKPIDIPKEWYEADDRIYASSEEYLINLLKKKNWDPKWYWFYHNPHYSDIITIDNAFECINKKSKK